MDGFNEAINKLKPHLMAVNLNGMVKGARPLIVTLGEGQGELSMMKALKASGYNGPIGIIDHKRGIDAEKVLRRNIEGLELLRTKLSE